jgi:vancomycin permeability regulator SanA
VFVLLFHVDIVSYFRRGDKLKKLSKIVCTLLFIYWLPFLFVWWQYKPTKSINQLPKVNTVIVFGTLVKDAKVSALLKERLDASMEIYKAEKAKEIVLSNTKEAVEVMKEYLVKKGIPQNDIKLDTTAVNTLDTCKNERKLFPHHRSRIFVSQGYHLARISYQCQKIGVKALLFPAELVQKKRATLFSSWEVFSVRITRYFREAGLTFLSLVGVYS